MKYSIIIGCPFFLFVGCFPIETDNADKAWKYWAGNKPPEEIELMNGEYYQSPHFTLEYEVFLKFKASDNWFNKFVAHNNLELDTVRNDWAQWTELPHWFNPNKNYLIYCKDRNDEFERLRFFLNPSTGNCFIYETVGM